MKRKAKNSQTSPFDEEKYRAIFESIHEGFCIYEIIYNDSGKPVDLRWIEVNPAYETQTGLADVVGQRHSELGLATEQYWYDIYDQVARTGEAVHFENWHEPTGRWYHVFTSRIGGAESKQVAVVFEDITERKRREEQLAFLSEITKDLVELNDIDGTIQSLTEKIGRHFKAQWCSFGELSKDMELGVSMSGWSADGVPPAKGTHKMRDLWTEEQIAKNNAGETTVVNDTQTDLRVSAEAYAALRIRSFITMPLARKGAFKFMMGIASATPREWRADEIDLLKELTTRIWARVERARAEKEMRASEEKYRSLFETIDEGFAVVELERDPRGKIRDIIYREVNESFALFSGLTNAVGRRASDLLPHLEQSVIDIIQTVADTGEPHRTEIHVADVNRWFSIRYSRVGGAGSPLIAGVFDDITERKEREGQQEFLLKLSDTLRAELNPDAVANRALEMLSEHLQLDRCYVGVYRLAEDRGDFPYQVGNERVPPLPTGVRLSDFPDALRVAFDRTLVIDDATETEGLSDMDRRSFDAIGLRALVVATLRKGENNPLWSIAAVSARPRRWTQGEVVVIEEVTERTWAAMERARTEAVLRENEERLRRVLDGMKEGFGVLAPDFTVLEHNREALRMDGRAREEIVGRSHWEVFPGTENSELGYLLKKAMVERVPVSLEHRYAWEADRALWLEMRAYPTSDGMLAVFWRDVTQRREAQDALRGSEARLQKAISIDTVGVLFFRLDGHLMDANAAFLKMVGYRRDELLAIQDWAVLTPPEFMEATSKTAGELAERGETAPYEKQMIRKDGTRFWGLFAPTRLSGSGLDSECVEFIIDITDRKRAEEALKALNESLEQRVQEKTAQLRNLASELTRAEQRERNRISHILHDDLQQRIYSILMRMNTLRNELPGQEQAVWNEVSELESEIKTTLEIARHLSIDLNPPILPGEGLLHAVQWLGQQMLERYNLSIQIQAEDPLILSDQELHVLLFNCVRELLFNVVKHADATQATILLRKSDGQFHIEVHDNGKGFSVETPPYMEKQSIDPAQDMPMSFGLSTIRHKLSLYGGRMDITSKLDEGTQVILDVSIAKDGLA